MGLYRLEYTNATIHELDHNVAEGSLDHSLFLTGSYSVNESSYGTLLKSELRHFQYVLSG